MGATFTYLSPHHWVSKDVKKTKFRLVTNLHKLNEGVEVEATTFTAHSEVTIGVNPKDKFFVVPDLVLGHQQMKIPEADHQICGILLEDGSYIYQMKPTSMKKSGRKFVNTV